MYAIRSYYGKRILAVDDEPDVLEVLQEEILGACPDSTFDRATTYEEAEQKLKVTAYDVVSYNFV